MSLEQISLLYDIMGNFEFSVAEVKELLADSPDLLALLDDTNLFEECGPDTKKLREITYKEMHPIADSLPYPCTVYGESVIRFALHSLLPERDVFKVLVPSWKKFFFDVKRRPVFTQTVVESNSDDRCVVHTVFMEKKVKIYVLQPQHSVAQTLELMPASLASVGYDVESEELINGHLPKLKFYTIYSDQFQWLHKQRSYLPPTYTLCVVPFTESRKRFELNAGEHDG